MVRQQVAYTTRRLCRQALEYIFEVAIRIVPTFDAIQLTDTLERLEGGRRSHGNVQVMETAASMAETQHALCAPALLGLARPRSAMASKPAYASDCSKPAKLRRWCCGGSPSRLGEYANHTAGGSWPPEPRSTRT